MKRLDEQIKAKKNELKASRDLVEAKSEQELDQKIKDLEHQVEHGKLTLVEEKKTLERISKMKRSRKQFAAINKQQEEVDALQAKIQETKASMSNPESKALSEQYSKIQTDLDALKAEQDEAYKSLSSLRDERTRLQNLQKEKWNEKRKLEDEYHQGRKAFQKYERDQKQKAWERQRSERERIEKERKKERAQKMLQEASDPAYLDEIRRANSLLHFFDPSFVVEKAPLQANKGLGAQAERKVDDSGIKGVKIVSKKDQDDDYLPAVQKGKKGKKNKGAKTGTTSAYNCPPSVVEDCAAMGIEPPMSADEVPATIEKIKSKLDHWKSDQTAQTQRVSSSNTITQNMGIIIDTFCSRTLKRPRKRLRSWRLRRPRRGNPRSPLALRLPPLRLMEMLPLPLRKVRARAMTRLSTKLPRMLLRRPPLRIRRRRVLQPHKCPRSPYPPVSDESPLTRAWALTQYYKGIPPMGLLSLEETDFKKD